MSNPVVDVSTWAGPWAATVVGHRKREHARWFTVDVECIDKHGRRTRIQGAAVFPEGDPFKILPVVGRELIVRRDHSTGVFRWDEDQR